MISAKDIIEECIKEQYKETISTIFKNKNKSKLSEEDIIKEFENLWISENSQEVSKKVKKPSTRKEVPVKEQCHALKKDTERCKGRKQKDGENPLLCPLHNNKGAKYGLMVETEINSEPELNSDSEVYNEEFN